MIKIAIFGAEGQLGRDLQGALSSHELSPLSHAAVDIVDGAQVAEEITRIRPDWVINAAAMTHVDGCEEQHVDAFRVNAIGARNIAMACLARAARLLHISTDYVFDGAKRKPYVETDAARPLNAYGISKFAGELYIRSVHEDHYIVRSSGLYGANPCRGKGGRNFVDRMLELGRKNDPIRVVADEVLTPTYTRDLAAQIARLIDDAPPPGIYHATNDGECSWYDFAKEIFRAAGEKVNLSKTTSAEWSSPAKRPPYSVLKNAALARAGIDVMPHWKDALGRYLAERVR